jgi:hypothetical protein
MTRHKMYRELQCCLETLTGAHALSTNSGHECRVQTTTEVPLNLKHADQFSDNMPMHVTLTNIIRSLVNEFFKTRAMN